MKARHEKGESGIASAHVLTISFVLLTVTSVCLVAVLIFGLHQKSSQGADFAALAASKASVDGKNGCHAAKRLAKVNGVRLVSCRMDADVATVSTKAVVSTPFGSWGIKSRARAAPDFYFS